MIPIKTKQEIECMRESCRLVMEILEEVRQSVEQGVTTGDVDRFAASCMQKRGVKSAFLGYRGFPGNICISVNEEVVHGIGGGRNIHFGDLVKVDVGIIHNGWIGDTAMSIPVGAVPFDVQHLMDTTEKALQSGIEEARAGNRVGNISQAIEKIVEGQGLSIVRDFVGHGVGRKLHEEPQIPNYGKAREGAVLKPGMVLAIEPMVNLGKGSVKTLEDKWTVVTRDGKWSSHFEHTVLVTEEEAEVLTCQRVTAFQ